MGEGAWHFCGSYLTCPDISLLLQLVYISGEAEGLLAKANAKARAVRLIADAIAKQVHCYLFCTSSRILQFVAIFPFVLVSVCHFKRL